MDLVTFAFVVCSLAAPSLVECEEREFTIDANSAQDYPCSFDDDLAHLMLICSRVPGNQRLNTSQAAIADVLRAEGLVVFGGRLRQDGTTDYRQ